MNQGKHQDLTTEQKILIERKYRNFILGGAGLKDEDKETVQGDI